MRIVFWAEHFPPYIGGVERSAKLLLPELRDRGIEFVIVTAHHYMTLPDEELWQGIPLYRFDFSTALARGDLAAWSRQQKRLAQVVNAFNPQLHHIFSVGPSMVACLQIMKQKPVPMIASLANVERFPQKGYHADAIVGKTLTAATWVTTVSRAILEQAVHYLPATKDRISVLYNGLAPTVLEPTPLAMPPRILLLGQLVVQKGGALAIAAFEKIYQRYPDARLIIAGDGPCSEKAGLAGLYAKAVYR